MVVAGPETALIGLVVVTVSEAVDDGVNHHSDADELAGQPPGLDGQDDCERQGMADLLHGDRPRALIGERLPALKLVEDEERYHHQIRGDRSDYQGSLGERVVVVEHGSSYQPHGAVSIGLHGEDLLLFR